MFARLLGPHKGTATLLVTAVLVGLVELRDDARSRPLAFASVAKLPSFSPSAADRSTDKKKSSDRSTLSRRKILSSEDSKNILRVEFEPGKASLLGKGTYGVVRRATELTTGRPVALKIVNKGLKTVQLEIEALKKVKECGGHPNVVALYGVVAMEDDPLKCGLVFELLEGGELYESLVKHGAYSESRASAVVRQVASALSFLHEDCKIAHADLKPENLLLRTADEDGAIAICDFGSAVDLDPDGSFEFSDKRLLGTVAYAAPELLANQYGHSSSIFMRKGFSEHATCAVDVWSLGCILYVILSGMHPFDPDNELTTDDELAKVIIKGQFDFSAPAWRDVSASAKDLIKKMLEKDSTKRITAREVLMHDWIRLPQRKESITGSDLRLIGFLRTQRRLQDHVFHLMLDGSLKNFGGVGRSNGDNEVKGLQNTNGSDEDAASLQKVFKSIDVEGKGFITHKDIERTFSVPRRASEDQPQVIKQLTSSVEISSSPDDCDEEKVYYSSLNGLVGCGERVAFKPDEIVFRRGDPGNSFYFVDRGRVEVEITENKPGLSVGAGDFFGETALIKNQPRNATVRAGRKGAELIRFSRDDFDRLLAGADAHKVLDEQVRKRTVEHLKFVFSSLFQDKQTVYVSHGDVLLKRGEPSETMYYIVDGTVDVISASGEVIAQRKEGETVGELGLVTGEPRSMDITCGTKRGCAFKKLDRADLDRLLQFSPLAHAEIQNALSSRGVPASSRDGQHAPTGSNRLVDVEIRRRWTVAQGSARASHGKPPKASTSAS